MTSTEGRVSKLESLGLYSISRFTRVMGALVGMGLGIAAGGLVDRWLIDDKPAQLEACADALEQTPDDLAGIRKVCPRGILPQITIVGTDTTIVATFPDGLPADLRGQADALRPDTEQRKMLALGIPTLIGTVAGATALAHHIEYRRTLE